MSSFLSETTDIESFGSDFDEDDIDWCTKEDLDILLFEDPFLYEESALTIEPEAEKPDNVDQACPILCPETAKPDKKRKERDSADLPTHNNTKKSRSSPFTFSDHQGVCSIDPTHKTWNARWRKGPLGPKTLCTTCSCAVQRKKIQWFLCPSSGMVLNSNPALRKKYGKSECSNLLISPKSIQEAYLQGQFNSKYLCIEKKAYVSI